MAGAAAHGRSAFDPEHGGCARKSSVTEMVLEASTSRNADYGQSAAKPLKQQKTSRMEALSAGLSIKGAAEED